MDPEEFARARERLSSDLSSLAFEHKQERLEWQRAMEAQAAEIQHLVARQDAMQLRLDALESFAGERAGQLQGDVTDLNSRVGTQGERIDGLDLALDRHEKALGDLRGELSGLSRATDEVFDDIADRVGAFDRSLASFDLTLSKQYEVLKEGLVEARDHVTEGLAEAHEAAEAHADAIVELKDAIATYQERRDAQDADSREQLAAMREQLADQRSTLAARQETLEQGLVMRLDNQESALEQLDDRLAARLFIQEDLTRHMDKTLEDRLDQAQRELTALGALVGQFAAQGQMLAQALESVQQGSMTAEQQLGTAMHEQFEALLRQLEQSTGAWHASLGQTQHHFKDFEAKVAKALGLQRNENLEHERHLTALKDDLTVLSTRVGTIVQLLTKANRPSFGGADPSAS